MALSVEDVGATVEAAADTVAVSTGRDPGVPGVGTSFAAQPGATSTSTAPIRWLRHDSRDGYGRHAREDAYVAADATSPNMCGRPSASAPVAPPPAKTATTATPIQVFRNCADLNAVYPGGVARVGVTGNTVSGSLRPFGITPRFDDALYEANRARDGDTDGIACEK